MYNKHAVHRCAPISAIVESDWEQFSLHIFIFRRYSKMAAKKAFRSINAKKIVHNTGRIVHVIGVVSVEWGVLRRKRRVHHYFY